VLALLDNGASNRAIAESLVIALPTVKEHISQIMRKLEVTNRRAAVQRAAELGILSS
jgi:ATP/maltotriose-dependent transcriptional regulator MalT